MESSQRSVLLNMPEGEKLQYDANRATSNIVDYEPNLLKHARLAFGNMADQIIINKQIPPEWTTEYVFPESPKGRDFNALEVAKTMEEAKQRKYMIDRWSEILPKFVAFLEMTMTESAQNRVRSVKDAEFKNAITKKDILNQLKIMIDTHTFIEGGAGFNDQETTRTEWATISIEGGESIPAFVLRYNKTVRKLDIVGVKDITHKQLIAKFLNAIKSFNKSQTLKTRVITYLSVVDTNNFPTDLNAIQSEMTRLDREENPIEIKGRVNQNAFATINSMV